MNDLLANRFRVIGSLGQGAMGAVYHVEDTLHEGREAALKVIQVQGEITPDLRLRFKEEFRAMSRLVHPNTVEVYDFGQLDDASHFLAMELVPGRDLSELAAGGKLPLAEAYPLVIQLLQALHFIHARLYVHRDIKAPNIRVRPDGRLKLIDFGLMTPLGQAANGKLTGTPGTMPPEVVRGGVIDQRSDLYAVGCLFYEMLTGTLPYTGKVMEVVRAHCQAPIPSLRASRPDAPPRLEALLNKLLAKDPAERYQDAMEVIDDLAALAGIAVARENVAQKSSFLVTSELVGRGQELDVLAQLLEATLAGRGGAVLLDAPAGVGKTRLARELLVQAKLADVPVFEAACLEKVVSPYKALEAALRPALALARREELDPILGLVFPEIAAPPDAQPGRDRQRLHAALADLLRTVASRSPVVVFFDDLQWADAATLEARNHLVRALENAPVMFMATVRGDEVPGRSPLWGPVAEGVVQHLRLVPFDPARVRELVVAMLREVELSDETARALYDATAGNAFFVTEVLRYLIEQGVLTHREGVWRFPPHAEGLELPPSVQETVVRRLAALAPEARALANVAAVLGRYQNRDMLRAIANLDDEALFARLDELVARQFIVKDGHRYTFPHDRVREALYAAMPDSVRATLHQRCGEYLEGLGDGRRETLVNKLAHHFSRGTDSTRAFRYLRLAGNRARAAGLVLLALQRWQQADRVLAELDLPERAAEEHALWWDLGEVGFNARPELAVEALEKLIPRLEGDEPMLAQAHGYLGSAYGFAGMPVRGLELVRQALERLPVEETPQHGALLMSMVVNLYNAGRIDECVSTAAIAAAALERLDLDALSPPYRLARVGAASFQNAVAYQGIRPSEALRDEALIYATGFDGPVLLNNVSHFFAVWYAWTGRQREAWQAVEQAHTNARRLGDAYATYVRACILLQQGEHEEAAAAIERALRLPPEAQQEVPRQLLLALSGVSLLARGELDAAEGELAALEATARESQALLILCQALLGRAQVALARGDLGRAGEILAETQALAADGPGRNPLVHALAERFLGEVALKAGRPAEALARLAAALAVFAAQDNPIELARTHEALGRAHQADGARQAAAQAFAAAGDAYHGIDNRNGLHKVTRALEKLAQTERGDLDLEQRWRVARAMQLG
ncbi:MAG: hypothetical protein JWM80_3917 [Cyanobacteria bacterium RYN_339]|nr:hypothetical protein [Cyanobacteria bacterium RYN_339]